MKLMITTLDCQNHFIVSFILNFLGPDPSEPSFMIGDVISPNKSKNQTLKSNVKTELKTRCRFYFIYFK